MQLKRNVFRVVELGSIIAAPFAGLVLAHLGFDVVKVEPLGGDFTRYDDVMGDSIFVFLNRGKRSMAIDLKKPEGRDLFLRLIARSNVLIENLSPGAMDRLGLGDDVLFKANPRLVYCSIKGYPGGEYRGWPAFGTLVEAASGVMWNNGNARLLASITDMGAALYCVIDVLWALLNNRPGHYEVTLYQSDAVWLGYYMIAYQELGKLFQSLGDALPYWAPYELFRTADDKYVYIAVANDAIWRRLCKALGLEGVMEDPRFRTNADRVRNRGELHRVIEDVTRRYTRDELLRLLLSNDVPAAPLMTLPEVINSDIPQFEETKVMSGVVVKVPKLPIEGGLNNREVPGIGQYTMEILREIGLNQEEINRLINNNVIK